jgi:hypothetical protein
MKKMSGTHERMIYMTTPALQQSDGILRDTDHICPGLTRVKTYPMYPTFFRFRAMIASGGRYDVVPQTVKVSSFDLRRAKPKSAICIRGYGPGPSSKMFSG